MKRTKEKGTKTPKKRKWKTTIVKRKYVPATTVCKRDHTDTCFRTDKIRLINKLTTNT